MADIDIINVGGVDYNIKDTTARSSINQKAPTSHASTATTYGVGNASNYGHVKLSDEWLSEVGAAANGIGASQSALFWQYWKVYGNTLWQHPSTYGGGSVNQLWINTTYVRANPQQAMAFRVGRLGLVQLGFYANANVAAGTDIANLFASVDFRPIIPYSITNPSAAQACAWGTLWNWNKGESYLIDIEIDPDRPETSRVHLFVGGGCTGISAGDGLYGSCWCLTEL